MNPIFLEFLLWASEAVILGLVTAVFRLWFSHMKLREEIARDYVRGDVLDKLFNKYNTDLTVVKETVEKILGMVHEIKGSMHGISRD